MSRIVKNYEILRPLGTGGMGSVHYAIETQLQREVALKSLRADIANNPGVIERFRAEAVAQARLNHPNIAHLYEFFSFHGEYFMAMEFVNGPTLSAVLRQRERLPFEEAANYAIQALTGLNHAHKHGIVHRDIKPANLMLNADSQIKVTDFGIARVSGASRSTRAGMIVGTYEYISPEAAQGLGTTALSDIYSLGVVLFELITGKLPFDSANEYELLQMHIQAPRPSLRVIAKDAPAALDDIVQQAINRNVRRRFRSAEDMATALQKCLERSGRRTSATGKWWESLIGAAKGEKTPLPEPRGSDLRKTAITSACHRIEDLIEQRLWIEAASAVEAGLRAYPNEPELIDLANRLQRQRQQYEQGVAKQVEFVRDLLSRGVPETAAKAAESGLATYPGAPALLELSLECRRLLDLATANAAQLAIVQQRVEQLIREEKFQEATDYVLELPGAVYGQNDLNKLLARILQARKDAERRKAVGYELSEADKAARAGEWDRAISIVDAAIGRFAGEASFEDCRADLVARRDAERRRQAVDELVAELEPLESAGALETARDRILDRLEELQQPPKLLAELDRLNGLLEKARREAAIGAALAEGQKFRKQHKFHAAIGVLDGVTAAEGIDARISDLRAATVSDLQLYQQRLDAAEAEAHKLIAATLWEDAVLRLSLSIREMPDEESLAGFLQDAQRGLAERRRADTIARIKAEAETFAQKHEFDGAFRLLFDGVSQYPEDQGLSDTLRQTVVDRDAYELREKVKAALEHASRLRAQGEFEGAIEALQSAPPEVTKTQEVKSKLEELEREWQDLRRSRAVANIALQVQLAIDSDSFEPALKTVVEGLSDWSDDPEILALGARLKKARREFEVGRALLAALQAGQEFEHKGSWEEAANLYRQTTDRFPETASQLAIRLQTAQERAGEEHRKARVEELGSHIARYLDAGLIAGAEAELAKAQSELAGDPALERWRGEIEAECRKSALDALVHNAIDRSRTAMAWRDFAGAAAILETAQHEAGMDAALKLALDGVSRAKQEYEAAIDSTIETIDGLCRRGEWEQAISAAVEAGERYPEESRFKELLKSACQRLEAERRRARIEARIDRIHARIQQGDLDGADELLQAARHEFPGEASLAAMRQEVNGLREARRAEDRRLEERITAVLQEARALLAGNERRQAISLLERAAAELNAPALSNLLERIREDEAGKAERSRDDVRRLPLQRDSESDPEMEARAQRLAEAEKAIRAQLETQQHEQALAEAERAVHEFPESRSIRNLRATIVVALEVKSQIDALAAQIRSLVAEGKAAQADRQLVEGLRKYPGRSEFEQLRPVVHGARTADWEAKSRIAGMARAIADIERLLRNHSISEAEISLRQLEADFGPDAAPELAGKIKDAAARQARPQEAPRLEQNPSFVHSATAPPLENAPSNSREALSAPAAIGPGSALGGDSVRKHRLILFATGVLVTLGALAYVAAKLSPSGGAITAAPTRPAGGSPTTTAVLLAAQPAELTFEYQNGQALPGPRSILIQPQAELQVEVTEGAHWLRARTNSPGRVDVSVRLDGLSVSTYRGVVRISPQSGSGSSVLINVTLHFRRKLGI
jgi:serine/threonine-protein kinase